MKNIFLDPKNGLSMSDATSISNMCNQRSREITMELESKNNYSAYFNHNGEKYQETEPKPLVKADTIELLKTKGRLHSLQAILMESLNAKKVLMENIQREVFEFNEKSPVMGDLVNPVIIELVDENWAKEQLTQAEMYEYLEQEAMASHIGQFIHKNGKLDKLRDELSTFKPIDFFYIKDDEKCPIKRIKHHTPEELLSIHEELAVLHRESEKRVNFYKAEIKNKVSAENIRINELNSKAITEAEELNSITRNEFSNASKKFMSDRKAAISKFEADRTKRLNEASKLKIVVPKGLQDLVDELIGNKKKK